MAHRGLRPVRALAVAAALAITLSACGPSSSTPESTTTTSSAPALLDSALKVTTASSAVPFGSPVDLDFTLTAGGSAVAAGKATVKVGGKITTAVTDAKGVGSLTLAAAQLPAGKQTITVSYAGDATTKPVSSTTTVTVEPAAASVVLTVTPGANGVTAVSAAVSTATGVDPAGTVSFAVDGTALSAPAVAAGVAAIEIPAGLTIGDHSVTADFAPTTVTELAAATAAATLSITKAASTVTATAHKEAVRYGDKGYFNVAVSPIGGAAADLTGTVSVLDAGTPVVEGTTDATGVASLAFSNTADPGTKTYTVVYTGNDGVVGSQADFAVQTTQTDVDFDFDKPTLKAGESGTLTVAVVGTPDKPTGAVVVTMDGVEIANGTLDADGNITAALNAVSSGSHDIEVSYAGDVRFTAETGSTTLKVKAPISNPNADGAAAINANNPCPATAVACVDLANTKAWLQSGGQVVYGPVSITSGRKGYRTPSGTFAAYWFDKDHKSSLYEDAPMPNSVFFNEDIAFHAGSLSTQSHGCIHLSTSASATFYDYLGVGDQVFVFGSAPY